jgi:hypothetical protein
MLDPAAAIASVTRLTPPATPYLPWGPALTDGDPVTGVDIAFSGARATSWTWAGGVWSHADDLAADGDEFGPANLLVLQVTTRDAGYEDPGGNPVPETVLEGSGEALVLSGGLAVAGQWSKGAATEPITVSAGGEPLTVPAGRTWIALVPEGGTVTTR